MHRFLPVAAVLVGWLALTGWWTYGFRAFTTDTAALAAAGPLPRPAPSVSFIDSRGDTTALAQFRGKFVLLTFMYLRCSGVCQLSMERLHNARARLSDAVPDRLLLLSVSLDPEHDDAAALAEHWGPMAHGDGWVAGRLVRSLDRRQAGDIAKLGVWASRAPNGRIDHAAFTLLLDPAGNVVDVFRPEDPVETMVAAVRRRLS